MTSVGDVYAALNRRYPMALKEPWDSAGVISGDWRGSVSRILVAVDITAELLDEAVAVGADCIVSHHPLVLPRHSIVSDPWKFRLMARANVLNVALLNAHTNADNARPGVTDALCDALGVVECDALMPTSLDSVTGTGRIGTLATPMTLDAFVSLISRAVPGAKPRTNGRGSDVVRRVAVCGGAGDSLLDVVRSTDADVYVTSDLRHHPVLEHVEAGGCTLIDIEHSEAEAVWLPQLADALTAELSVPVVLSKLSTSAWAS